MQDGLINFDWGNLLNSLLNGLYYIIDFLFGWINLPQVPTSITGSINSFLDLIFDNLSLFGFFVRPTTIKIIIPLVIVVINFKYIYKFIMWFLKKLPFINIK